MKLNPILRMATKEAAEKAIKSLGLEITNANRVSITFLYRNKPVTLHLKKEWATGKTIKDSRGMITLLNQLKPRKSHQNKPSLKEKLSGPSVQRIWQYCKHIGLGKEAYKNY